MLDNKEKVAKHFNKIFNSQFFINYISEKSSNDSNSIISNIKDYFANIIYYTIATRSPNLTSETLNKLTPGTTLFGDYFIAGEEIAKELASQLKPKNNLVSTQELLNLFKNNYHTNGFYIHAFNPVFENNFKLHGVSRKNKNIGELNDLRKKITALVHYDFEETSYRFYVSSKYEVLYNYGIYSPEWFYNLIKNNDVMIDGDTQKASKKIIETILNENKNNPSLDIEDLKPKVKRLCEIILNTNNKVSFAMFDKETKTETGQRLFPEYLEQAGLKDKYFDMDFINNKLINSQEKKLSAFIDISNQNDLKTIGDVINKIIKKGSLYELHTHHEIKPDTFVLFNSISPNKIIKHKKIIENNIVLKNDLQEQELERQR